MVNFKRNPIIIALSILSLIFGGLIYVLWRPNTLNMFSWFSAIGLGQIVDAMRVQASGYFHFLPKWLYFSAPQALWLFSGSLMMHIIWHNPRSWKEQFWIVLVFLIAIGGEFGQALGIIQGTFDPIDISLVVVAFIVAEFIAFRDNLHKQSKTIKT